MVPGLAERFQVIVFDNRGVGQTDRPDGPYSAQMLAADTAGLLEALGIPEATVMGHSMGGFVAQALVLERPELVDKLILAATNFGGPNHIPVTQEAMAVLSDVSGDPIERFKRGLAVSTAPGFVENNPDVIEEWLAYREQNPIAPGPYQAQMAVGLGLMAPENAFEGKLAAVEQPALILFGEVDKVVPPENAQLLHERLPQSEVVLLPNAGHFFPLEVPERAVEVITAFVEE
jgi:pimeloyl-ACP methyl ester carboxylesterase